MTRPASRPTPSMIQEDPIRARAFRGQRVPGTMPRRTITAWHRTEILPAAPPSWFAKATIQISRQARHV